MNCGNLHDGNNALGNGEVDSSILSGSTIHPTDNTAIYVIDFCNLILQSLEGTTA